MTQAFAALLLSHKTIHINFKPKRSRLVKATYLFLRVVDRISSVEKRWNSPEMRIEWFAPMHYSNVSLGALE